MRSSVHFSLSTCRYLVCTLGIYAALLCAENSAEAHQSSITYSNVNVEKQHVNYRLRINIKDLGEAVGLETDAVPTEKYLLSNSDKLFSYIWKRITVFGGQKKCAPTDGKLRFIRQKDHFVDVRWKATCSENFRVLAIEYFLFFELDPRHSTHLRVSIPQRSPAITVLRNGEHRFEWNLDKEAPSGVMAFIQSGIEHIAFGFDHLAFVIALLLIAIVRRNEKGTWEHRGIRGSVLYTAGIVTTFTIAHSLTLIAASMGAITLAPRIVESAIAASIVFIAVENIVYPQTKNRFLITFAFGLIHGLGFASVLEAQLPPRDVLVPLLSFNLGVEFGQLCVVLALVPVLYILAQRMGTSLYRKGIVFFASSAIAALGALWFISRAFNISFLGF